MGFQEFVLRPWKPDLSQQWKFWYFSLESSFHMELLYTLPYTHDRMTAED